VKMYEFKDGVKIRGVVSKYGKVVGMGLIIV
jgi:hypothetical protein